VGRGLVWLQACYAARVCNLTPPGSFKFPVGLNFRFLVSLLRGMAFGSRHAVLDLRAKERPAV
jgi:hypothetical protein